MAGPVYVSTYEEPPFRTEEILRYAGASGADQEDILRLERECTDTVKGKLSYRVCWLEVPVLFDGKDIDLGFVRTDSVSLRRHLADCERAVLFAATVGIEMDRFIARSGAVSPARALMLQAIGAERIEALCDRFCEDVSCRAEANGQHIRSRFSPGYGDLPIEIQRDIFRVLDCPRKIGLTLNDSLIMSPSKSVTAIIGISKNGPGTDSVSAHSSRCTACAKADCPYRKELSHENQ